MSNEYIKREDAIKEIASMGAIHGSEGAWVHQADVLGRLRTLPPADVIERAKCDSCEVRNDSYIEAVSATGYDHGFEDGYSKGRAERKRGEWTDRNNDPSWAIVNFAYCSECKQPIMHKHERPLWNFCPNCGAQMKGADDE